MFLTLNAVAKMIGMAKGNLPPDPLFTEKKPTKEKTEESKSTNSQRSQKSKEAIPPKEPPPSEATPTATPVKKKLKVC